MGSSADTDGAHPPGDGPFLVEEIRLASVPQEPIGDALVFSSAAGAVTRGALSAGLVPHAGLGVALCPLASGA